MNFNECCGCVMTFSAACQWHMMEQYCCYSGSTNNYFACASYFDRKPMMWFQMCGYIRWPLKAQDYSSCIVLYPSQVRCHIMSRIKQQWTTVVNSWQNKSRYMCGSCSTCQESSNRCHTTQLKVACPSNIGDMCNHGKMTVWCKTQILHWLFERNMCIADSDWCR